MTVLEAIFVSRDGGLFIGADGSVIDIGESVTVTAVGTTTLTVRRNP